MRVAPYATLLVDVVLVMAVLAATPRLDPRAAARLIASATVVVAGSWIAALGVLAAGAFGGLVVAVDLDRWPTSIALRTPVPAGVEILAAAGLVLTAAALAVTASRIAVATRERGRLRRALADTELAVAEMPAPIAFALPGRPARIVVSPAMLRALDAGGRRALLAHERAHLRFHHHRYQAVADVGAALNPLLIPVRVRMRYCLERWADEESARELGERRVVARALAQAGLAVAGQDAPAAAFAATGVPARVEALLQAPPRTSRWDLVAPAGLGLTAIALAAEAAHDLEHLFELAIRLTR